MYKPAGVFNYANLFVLLLIVIGSNPNGINAQPLAPSHLDDLPGKPRVFVLSDIGNEPDDQMSLVRFLVYANEYDIEGLVATTSTWQRDAVRTDIMNRVIDAYEQIQPNLLKHEPGFPEAASLRALVKPGQPSYGMAAVGDELLTEGAALLIEAADRNDARPLWVTAWGGNNTLAQALWHVRKTRAPQEVDVFVNKLRVYTISDQDNAGPWIRREFPNLLYIVSPSTPDGAQYYLATWTGIAGDRYYRNAPGADFTTVTNEWLEEHIRSKGPLGAAYPKYEYIMEGDTPSYMNLIGNGLAGHYNPSWGGWGGRYFYRYPSGESRAIWTQGGDSYPGVGNSRDIVTGVDGQPYSSDQATIWRWREAFQHDFAARMDWTIRSYADANHNPEVVVNGEAGIAPLIIEARMGQSVNLDATATTDPDGDALAFNWFHYTEAGSGMYPGRPVASGELQGEPGEFLTLKPRVVFENAATARTTATPQRTGIFHLILQVTDDGTPALTSYRRVVLMVEE